MWYATAPVPVRSQVRLHSTPPTDSQESTVLCEGWFDDACIWPTTINLDDGNRSHCSARLKTEDTQVLCHCMSPSVCSRSCPQTVTWSAPSDREFWSNFITTWTRRWPNLQQAKEMSHSLSNRAQEASLNNPIKSQLTHSHPPVATAPHLPSSITTRQSQPLHQTPHAADHYHPLSALPPSSSTSVQYTLSFCLDYTLRRKKHPSRGQELHTLWHSVTSPKTWTTFKVSGTLGFCSNLMLHQIYHFDSCNSGQRGMNKMNVLDANWIS
jgi:hypothetical protein